MKTTIFKKRGIKKNGGFTLVELIVVIVILGILAAIAVPSLVGYIDKTKEQAAIADARNILTGLQTLAITDGIDNAGNKVEGDRNNGYFAYVMPGTDTRDTGCDLSDKGVTAMANLHGLDEAKVSHPQVNGNNGLQGLDAIVIKDGKVLSYYYISNGYKVTYNSGDFTVERLP